MNKKIIYILFAVFITFSACKDFWNESEDECADPDYSDCDTEEPFSVYIDVAVTVNDENSKVPIKIFMGNYEDNNLYASFDTSAVEFEYLIPVTDKYTFVVEYYKGNDTILAIDACEIRKKSKTYCDSTCWEVNSASLDLTLNF